MVCNSCGEKPKNTAKDFTKAVVEINNPDKLVLFRKVVVPVSMGTEEDFPASVGKYYNVLLQYEANGDMYLYSSDGIPTKLSSDVSELQHELEQLGIKVDGEILARIAADSALEDSITALDDSLSTVAKTGDYNDLTNKPTIGNATLTIKRNNANVGTFTANATANKSIDISVPTKTSDITNDGSDGSSTYVENDELSAVATSGSYNDLLNKPTIGNATLTIKKNNANVGTFTANATSNKSINITVPTKTSELTNNGSDNTSTYVEADELATVATTGNYNDLTNKPTIGNATLTIKRNSTQLGTFKANATSGTTVDISVPTKTSDLTNDGADGTSTFVETDDLPVVDTTYSASSNNAIANSTVTNSLNRDVMTNLTLDASPSTTTVNLNNTKTNLASPSSTTTTAITLPVASSTQAGVMNSSTFDAVTNNTNNINALLSGAVAVTGLPASPTQAQITSAWESETGLSSLINRASVYDVTNNKVWTYYTNDTTWHAASNTSQVTVNTFTNSSEGVIKGSTNAGQVFAENDGTGSVNGWDTLTGTVANHTSKLATIEQGAEVNVQSNWTQTNTSADDYIKNKPANLVQDANYVHTDNNFTTTLKNKLNGIESGAEVNVQADWSQSNTSADDYIKNKPTIPTVNNATLTIQKNGTNVQTFTANSSTNKTANITVPTAVSELTNDASYATTTQLNNGLATKQNTLTAGSNITITNNTISATDTTYTAGNAIDITNNVISANVYPADFFTNTTETVTAEGTDITMQGTALAPFVAITPKGDTSQQTYTGKNLFNTKTKTSQVEGLNLTVEDNNNITLADDGTHGGWRSVSFQVDGLTANAQYAFRFYQSNSNTSMANWLNVKDGNNQDLINDYYTSGSTVTFTVTTTSAKFYFYAQTSGSTVANNTATITNIQLGAGSTLGNYEPYVGGVPSPNPDYPQDVKVVTGEQTVTVTGKNLLPFIDQDFTFRGMHYYVIDGSLYRDGTSTGETYSENAIWQNYFTFRLPAGTYNITYSGSTSLVCDMRKSSDNSVLTADVTMNRRTRVFTLAEETEVYLGFYVYNVSANNEKILLQLEKGETPSSYEPYTGSQYEINLGKNLLNPSQIVVGFVTNTGAINTAVSTGDMATPYFIPVQPNTKVTFTIFETTSTYAPWFGMCEYSAADETTFITRQVNQDSGITSVAFTVGASTHYIRVSARNMIAATKYQLEYGDKTDYAPYFEPIELCKIGNYQDYIYKSGGNWYKHNAIGKAVYTGKQISGFVAGQSNDATLLFTAENLPNAKSYLRDSNSRIMSDRFTAINTWSATVTKPGICTHYQYPIIRINRSSLSTEDLDGMKAWANANPIAIYYTNLTNETDTQITDEALIEQLNALSNANSYRDTTYITTASDGYNLPMILTVEMFTNSLAGISKAIDGKQNKLIAGENITIDANNVISATATGNSTITMTDTDPGEGQPLAADNYIAVYGGSGRGGFSRYTANQSIPAATATTLLPDTTQTPDDGISYANGVAVIQKAGWWILSATVGGAQTAAGYLTVEIAVNNVLVSSASGATTANYTHCRNVIWAGKLSVGDTVKVQVTAQSAMNITKRERGVFCGVLVSED